MRYLFQDSDGDSETINIQEVKSKGENWYEVSVRIGDEQKSFQWRKVARQFFFSEDGVSWNKTFGTFDHQTFLNINRHYQVFRGYRPSSFSVDSEGGLVTQMPGKIVKILVEVGQEVKKGDPALVLEAMKMENEVKCNQDGKVSAIHISEGESVESGVLLIEVESEKG